MSATRKAALFEAPPAMNKAIRDWAQMIYAGHVLATLLPKIERTQDATRPIRDAIKEMEEAQQTFVQDIATLGPGEKIKFYTPVVYDTEIVPKYTGVSRKKYNSNLDYQLGTGSKIVNYKSMWMDLPDATDEVRQYLEAVHSRAVKTLRVMEQATKSSNQADSTLVEMTLLKRECLKYVSKPKAYTAKATTTVPVDLTGWKYVSSGSPIIAEVNKQVEKRNDTLAYNIERGGWELEKAQEAYDQLIKGVPLDPPQEYRLDQDSSYWSAHRVRLAVEKGDRPSQAYTTVNVLDPVRNYTTTKIVTVEEAANLMEPLLGPHEIRKALAAKDWTEIKLILDFKGHEGRGGQWHASKRELQIDVVNDDATTLVSFNAGMTRIAEVARHETQHIGQDLLRLILGLREDAGLPSRNIRDPQTTNPATQTKPQRVDHALLDVEFYTDLSDAIDSFTRIVNKVPVPEQRDALRTYVGLAPKTTALRTVSNAFLSWKKDSPAKWKKAVAEFVKELNQRGIRIAHSDTTLRTQTIRLAAYMPKGSPERRALLGALTKSPPPLFREKFWEADSVKWRKQTPEQKQEWIAKETARARARLDQLVAMEKDLRARLKATQESLAEVEGARKRLDAYMQMMENLRRNPFSASDPPINQF